MSKLAFRIGPGGRKPKAAIRELSRVRLTVPVSYGKGELPAGAAGTVVHCYEAGRAFEVEFSSPVHALVTVEAEQVVGPIE